MKSDTDMNRLIPPLSVYLMIFLLLQVSCKKEVKKNPENTNENTPSDLVASDQSDKSDESRVFTTKSGKAIELRIHSDEDGMFDFHLIPKGFEFTRDTLILTDSNPLSEGFLADLDNNGFEELYLITTAEGSGSYGHIHGFASNSDKSLTPIYLRPIHENDLAPGELFDGYMGHDSIFMDQGKLMRKFPVYREGDPNCCPTGGIRQLRYNLVPGEATWKLEAQIHKQG